MNEGKKPQTFLIIADEEIQEEYYETPKYDEVCENKDLVISSDP